MTEILELSDKDVKAVTIIIFHRFKVKEKTWSWWKEMCVCVSVCLCVFSHSVISDSLESHGLCSLPGSSVQGIIPEKNIGLCCHFFSRGSSWPNGRTHVSCISCIGRCILDHCATWEFWEEMKRTQWDF